MLMKLSPGWEDAEIHESRKMSTLILTYAREHHMGKYTLVAQNRFYTPTCKFETCIYRIELNKKKDVKNIMDDCYFLKQVKENLAFTSVLKFIQLIQNGSLRMLLRPDREEETVPARVLAEALQLRGLRRKQTYC